MTQREESEVLLFTRWDLGPSSGTRQQYRHPSSETSEENLYQL
jgi:hypothetical protein